MGQRQLGQDPFPSVREIDQDLAPVLRILTSFGQAIGDQPVDQLNCGVVPNTKAFGQDANRDLASQGTF